MNRETLKIANPCTMDFDEMAGDGHRRFCGRCEKHVHNLSDLTREEARDLLADNEGEGLCVVYTFDRSKHPLFQEEMGFKRPSKAQLRGVKRLIAAAALVPLLALLPSCEPGHLSERPAIERPCDLSSTNTFKPIDDIIEAEQKFLSELRSFLGFDRPEEPDFELIAGGLAPQEDFYPPPAEPEAEEPDVVENEGEVHQPKGTSESGSVPAPKPVPKEPEPQLDKVMGLLLY